MKTLAIVFYWLLLLVAAAVFVGSYSDVTSGVVGGIGIILAIIGLRVIVRLSRSTALWRNANDIDQIWSDPATEKQKDFADDLGISYLPSITKGELFDLIKTGKGIVTMPSEKELCRRYDLLAKDAENQRDEIAWERGEGPPPDISLHTSPE